MDEREREVQPTQKAVSVNWQVPDDMVSRYVNNVFVQQGEYEFIVSSLKHGHRSLQVRLKRLMLSLHNWKALTPNALEDLS